MPDVILITHAADEKDDRAAAWFAASGYTCRWVRPDIGEPLPAGTDGVAACVVYGGRYDVNPKNVHPFLGDETRFMERCFAADVPVLGLCLGAQMMADLLGAPAGPHPDGYAEYGYYDLEITQEGRTVFGAGLKVLESHWHGWFDTSRGCTLLAQSELFPQQAIRYGEHHYGFQFHPEASFETMARWAGRRGERNNLPGAYPVERQLADHALYDKALGDWFFGFLDGWIGRAGQTAAAE